MEARGQAVPATWLGPKPPRIFPHHLLSSIVTLVKHTTHNRTHTHFYCLFLMTGGKQSWQEVWKRQKSRLFENFL